MQIHISESMRETRPVYRDAVWALAGAVLLYAASQLSIPLQPVPITLQTVAVLLIGLTYTPRAALAAHGVWLGLAAMGLPVLADHSGGWVKFIGPTGGYLLGMPLAAWSMAWLRPHVLRRIPRVGFCDALLGLLGTFLILALGVLWLAVSLNSMSSAVQFGLLPFIFPGILKVGILVALLHSLRLGRK